MSITVCRVSDRLLLIADIAGGNTVPESADIFISVLVGEATPAQTNVVLCNAALAIQTLNADKAFLIVFTKLKNRCLAKKR